MYIYHLGILQGVYRSVYLPVYTSLCVPGYAFRCVCTRLCLPVCERCQLCAESLLSSVGPFPSAHIAPLPWLFPFHCWRATLLPCAIPVSLLASTSASLRLSPPVSLLAGSCSSLRSSPVSLLGTVHRPSPVSLLVDIPTSVRLDPY